MENLSEFVELLFFDTFAHDNTEEINLDLVQFPKPVYVTEVRIIPLGARVQADFPGGVRLGATNPSQFKIEFFVNDLGKPGASTFESLGGFEYNQNGCINLECAPDETIRKIPTDGLVLRGWYTTITLAVYGTLTKNIAEQIVQPVVNPPVVPSQPNLVETQQILPTNHLETEWPTENITIPIDYNQPAQPYQQPYTQPEPYQPEYTEYYPDPPKDPRNYHVENAEWNKVCPRPNENERERERSRDTGYEKSDRDHRNESDKRDRERDKIHSSNTSRDRERQPRDYRGSPRDNDHDRSSDRERIRDRSYKHEDSCRRSYSRTEEKEREDRKRPRTPPIMSPKRPKTPHEAIENPPESEKESNIDSSDKKGFKGNVEEKEQSATAEEPSKIDVEEFEPILSDEDILDDNEQYQDVPEDFNEIGDTDDLVRVFIPGSTDLTSYQPEEPYKISEDSIEVSENLKIVIGICDDYFKSSITKYSTENFSKLSPEIKEEFIHLCEKLTFTIGSVEKFITIIKLYQEIQSFASHKWNAVDTEISDQINFIFDSTVDWLKIALNYDLANSQDQPIYKIRHIKCGLRIAQFCFESNIFLENLFKKNFGVFKVLLNLYQEEFMAPSIKLMILKALDTCLIHKFGMDKFLEIVNRNTGKQNGFSREENKSNYSILLNQLKYNTPVRLKFSLCSIIKKINIYEIFTVFHSVISKLKNSESNVSTSEINLIGKFLEQILQYLRNEQFTLTQPKRFLPVSSQFEIVREQSKNVLLEYFKIFNFVESLVLLLTHPLLSNLPVLKIPILEVVYNLSETRDGIDYMSSRSETMNVLLKYLLQTEEDEQYSMDIKSQSLGIVLAYKLRTHYHIAKLLDIGEKNIDLSSNDILDELHGLFCLSLSPVGKIAMANVLGMTENFKAVIQFINIKEKPESQSSKLKKSPAILYVIDLVHIVLIHSSNIEILEKFKKEISHLSNYEGQQEICSNKLNSINAYISPVQNTITYDNISSFVDIIAKEIDNLIERPEQIITSLRIIYSLGVSKHAAKSAIFENPFNNYVELKYKHVILQLFSLDGVALITKILHKICDYYEQPSVHLANFMSQQGLSLVEIVYPCVILLKQMLTYAIQCRNTNFKDLTAVPVLLQTYNLMNSYPMDSPHFVKCGKVKESIVEILLVYTQPISDEIHEKDTLNKTLWSLMCKEVIQYITTAPYTFISGLLVFSELLPLPLPIQTNEELQENDTAWMINLRKLWAAHLHPLSPLIQDFVNKLCTTSNQSLLNLLRRICVQISDLAANSALMIARGVLDAVNEEITPKENAKVTCTLHLARLLNFLACLVTHCTLKCAVLSLFQTQEQKYSPLISYFVQILKTNNQISHHIQCQECILSIIQSFCDAEISLMQNSSEQTSNLYLSNALPTKDHLISFIEVISEHLFNNNSFVTYLPAVRTIFLLTEHDYGFYHLREILLKRSGLFSILLDKLSKSFAKDNAECISVLNTLIEFFCISIVVEDVVVPLTYSPRTMKFSLKELKALIAWKDEKNEEKHPLEILKESVQDSTFEGLRDKLSALLNSLNNETQVEGGEIFTEPTLPIPEPLLAQFSRRVVYNCTDTFNERLTAEYWLSVPNEETDSEIENIASDLTELCKQNLSDEYNLVREIEILCRISSANIIEKEKKNDDQKIKKPLTGPLRTRGFPRMVQQRPDLFRSRPPNTSRPPSLHVDDFVALETCGAQPTGPTGYNKVSRELMASRNSRGSRGRAFVTSERAVQYRQMSWWGSGFGRFPY
ncbi:protein virilizer isoform X2 [Coccinella septempunctata]|uniref:protein virilizer isoform X2 n=1 Tax=Coccinella septempunctata TaxID=41139 RepID=UPI001D0702E2|nr:protein virilizer isoform X2 [Coccinella septempunctata]